jgi:hypothetical protein
MLLGWFDKKPPRKIGFEDVKYAIDRGGSAFLLINTLPASDQGCLIKNTLDCRAEETTLNEMMNKYMVDPKTIIVYGKNAADLTVEKKYYQLVGLGFSDVVMYCGGIFEWVLLQDLYGVVEFPTVGRELDILKFRPAKIFGVARIEY